MSQLQENQLFAENYLLKKYLGGGSFGDVWFAEYKGVDIAIKIYNQLDEQGVEDFLSEFKIAFDLNHSNLLHISYYDVNEGHPYLVMPYCPQGSAKKYIGRIDEATAWRFLRDVASGLAYLHKLNPVVIHQDIKPDNILISINGDFVITDFGISKRVRSSFNRSMRNISSGTRAYMGPERYSKTPSPIMASDVWSLGATMFELLTGDVPFGEIGGVMQKDGAEIPLIEGNYSEELKQTIEKCLSKETWDRPTAEQLSKYAQKIIEGEKPSPWQYETQESTTSNQDSGRPTQPIEKQEQIAQEEQKIIVTGKKNKKHLWLWVAYVIMVSIIVGGLVINNQMERKQERIAQEQEQQRKAQELNIPMVYVSGGTFTMGCTSEQSDCNSDESPTHRVTLSSFYIGKYEVTQAQWEAVMGSNPSYFKGDNLPVENVSWNEVMDFIDKLNAKTGKRYRLPTEAEWEFAARGGNQSNGTMYAGAYSLNNAGWYRENSGDKTHPVGQKTPNELGIYDMSGNVWEWCSDWFGDYSSSSQTNPKGPSSGSGRVLRGGRWSGGAGFCRVSNRGSGTPGYRGNTGGFRLVLVP